VCESEGWVCERVVTSIVHLPKLRLAGLLLFSMPPHGRGCDGDAVACVYCARAWEGGSRWISAESNFAPERSSHHHIFAARLCGCVVINRFIMDGTYGRGWEATYTAKAQSRKVFVKTLGPSPRLPVSPPPRLPWRF